MSKTTSWRAWMIGAACAVGLWVVPQGAWAQDPATTGQATPDPNDPNKPDPTKTDKPGETPTEVKPPEKLVKDHNSVLTEEEKKFLKEKREGPSRRYAISPRFRLVSIPDATLDLFLERHAESWNDGPNFAYGLEFMVRNPDYAWVFWAEFADLKRKDDWFLEKDDPARKADWTTFPIQMPSLGASARWYWDLSPVFSFYAGAGLGVALVLGEIEKTDPAPECVLALGESEDPSLLDKAPCYENGQPKLDPAPGATETEDRIPPVLPIIDVTGGMQVTIYDHVIWKLELGLHTYTYAGTSLGVQWW